MTASILIRSRKQCSRSAKAKLERLAELISEHDKHCWEIGDVVSELVQSHRMPLSVISKMVNYSKPRLSEFAVTARFFAPAERTANFQDSLMARRVFVRFPALKMNPTAIRDHISQMHRKRPGEIKAYFAQLHADKLAIRSKQESKDQLLEQWEGHCFHDDWRNVLPKLPDHSVKVINADPPFGNYSWRSDGGYLSSRALSNGLRIDSEANSDQESKAATFALFDVCLSKLQEGGCLLLWQPGARPDNLELIEKAITCGWELPVALTWLKANTAIAAEDCPYAPTTERILIFVPKGTKLIKHERDLSRSDVLAYPSETIQASRDVRAGRLPPQSVHMFQKPLLLMEHLLRKHSYPGDLVVDCFGCSGAACIAANNLRRRWVYIEKHDANFRWGQKRISTSISTAELSHLNSKRCPNPIGW